MNFLLLQTTYSFGSTLHVSTRINRWRLGLIYDPASLLWHVSFQKGQTFLYLVMSWAQCVTPDFNIYSWCHVVACFMCLAMSYLTEFLHNVCQCENRYRSWTNTMAAISIYELIHPPKINKLISSCFLLHSWSLAQSFTSSLNNVCGRTGWEVLLVPIQVFFICASLLMPWSSGVLWCFISFTICFLVL